MSYRNDAAMREQIVRTILANCRITLKLKQSDSASHDRAVQDRAAPGQLSTDLSAGDRHEKV